jgi:hypothetical protein
VIDTAAVPGPMPALSSSPAAGVARIRASMHLWFAASSSSKPTVRLARRTASARAVVLARSSVQVRHRENVGDLIAGERLAGVDAEVERPQECGECGEFARPKSPGRIRQVSADRRGKFQDPVVGKGLSRSTLKSTSHRPSAEMRTAVYHPTAAPSRGNRAQWNCTMELHNAVIALQNGIAFASLTIDAKIEGYATTESYRSPASLKGSPTPNVPHEEIDP